MGSGRVGCSFSLTYWEFSSITGCPCLSNSEVSKKAGRQLAYIGQGLLWDMPYSRRNWSFFGRNPNISMRKWYLWPCQLLPERVLGAGVGGSGCQRGGSQGFNYAIPRPSDGSGSQSAWQQPHASR